MFARVVVLIVCCGLRPVSALRFSEVDLTEWLPRLSGSVATLVAGHNFTDSVPVLLTLADVAYEEFLVPWAAKSEEFGFAQKLVVTLAASTSALCATHSLPSVLIDSRSFGLLVNSLHAPTHARTIPSQLPLAKFGVPYVLLQMGFDSVVVSEMDVFFFASPLPMLQDVRSRTGASVLAMPDDKRRPLLNETNIGFMMLAHGSETLLLKFLTAWWEKRSQVADVGSDQLEFQALSTQFLEDRAVNIELLDWKFFAVRPRDLRADTIVLHLAYARSECKHDLLESLYHGKQAAVSHRVQEEKHVKPESGTFKWYDC